jgi:hypothetical protein
MGTHFSRFVKEMIEEIVKIQTNLISKIIKLLNQFETQYVNNNSNVEESQKV